MGNGPVHPVRNGDIRPAHCSGFSFFARTGNAGVDRILKNILFISTNDAVAWGGSEELWSGAAQRLVRQGHRVTASIWKRDPEHERIVALRHAGVAIHGRFEEPIRRDRFGQAWLTLVQGVPASVRANEMEAVELVRPELVVFSLGYQWCPKFQRMSRVLRERGIPYTVVVQLVIEGFPLTDAITARFQEAYGGARHVWFVSQQNAEIMGRELGHRFDNASLVDNPVDLDVAVPPYPSTEDGWHLAVVGSLTPHHKGQDLLIEVLSRPEWRERSLHVSFQGDGASKGTLQRWVRVNDLKNVHFKGFESDKNRIWAAHHAALFTSRMEGRSLALQEAMAHGRMVISTDVGGARDLIAHGTSGFLVPAITPDGLALALDQAWAQRESWQEMGVEARRAIRRFVAPDPIGRFAEAVKASIT